MFTVSVSPCPPPSPRTGDEVAIIQSRITLVHHSALIRSSDPSSFLPSEQPNPAQPGYCSPTYHPCYQVESRVDDQSAKNCQLADQFPSNPSGGVVLQLKFEILRRTQHPSQSRQHHRDGTTTAQGRTNLGVCLIALKLVVLSVKGVIY